MNGGAGSFFLRFVYVSVSFLTFRLFPEPQFYFDKLGIGSRYGILRVGIRVLLGKGFPLFLGV